LKDLGHREGRNVAYEYRWAEGKPDRLDELAKELVDLKVDAIAAKKATKTIPLSSQGVGDPVGAAVVPSLSHPGGNINRHLDPGDGVERKRLEILKEIVPNAAPVAMFWNDTNPGMVLRARETQSSLAFPHQLQCAQRVDQFPTDRIVPIRTGMNVETHDIVSNGVIEIVVQR
jgi:putative tryptophan/tyrosine transport system substrate-binding protein